MALKRVVVDLYVYTGTSGSYTASDKKYTLQKEVITGQSNIILEIGELVRDYIDVTFNNDYLSTPKWVTASITYYKDNDVLFAGTNPVTTTYLAFDGYGYFEDEINPQLSTNALYTSNNMYLPEGTAGKLPIFAEGVGKVIIDSTTTQITDSGNSNQKIQYVTIPANSSTIQVYDTNDTTLKKTITVTNVCEPKYTSYKLTFINKYGAYQDIYMFKKTVESFNVTEENYKRNIINTSTVTYPVYDNQKQRYNVNAQTSLTMNTGFVDEDFNTAVEELFLTENAWIRFEGKTLPIIPKSKSKTFQTSLNDKLINHTIDFEFAFDKINNVR
tara:strand:- start:1236 stop:2222 length:987 start_codon:yes stop_codon:yes gene_type:complete